MNTSHDIKQMMDSLRTADIEASAERYHYNRMSPVEARLFLELLEQEPALKEQVHWHLMALRAADVQGREALRAELAQIREQSRDRRASRQAPWTPYALLAAAAAALLLLFTPVSEPEQKAEYEIYALVNEFGAFETTGAITGRTVGFLLLDKEVEELRLLKLGATELSEIGFQSTLAKVNEPQERRNFLRSLSYEMDTRKMIMEAVRESWWRRSDGLEADVFLAGMLQEQRTTVAPGGVNEYSLDAVGPQGLDINYSGGASNVMAANTEGTQPEAANNWRRPMQGSQTETNLTVPV